LAHIVIQFNGPRHVAISGCLEKTPCTVLPLLLSLGPRWRPVGIRSTSPPSRIENGKVVAIVAIIFGLSYLPVRIGKIINLVATSVCPQLQSFSTSILIARR